MVHLADRISIVDKSRSGDGFLKVRARAAKAGVYDYLGAEVDPAGKTFKADQVVKVYRPANEVFDAASLASFVGKPITNDHPAESVTAANWRDHARGAIFGAVKDGDYVGFDMAFMDAATIAAVDAGKRELSNGYACDLSIEDGTAPDGTPYQAVQRNIRGNHCALVDRGRAGPECRVGDAQPQGWPVCDAITADKLAELKASLDASPQETRVKITNLDGMPVNLSDAAAVEAALKKLDEKVTEANQAKDKALADLATVTTEKSTLDAKVTTLEKQVADAKLTPQQLRDAAKAYAAVCDKAKALGVTVSDEMDEPAVMKAVVSAKIGDAAKDWNDAQIAASFATLTADVKAEDKAVVNINPALNLGDAATDYFATRDKAKAELSNRWQQPAANAA